MPIKIPKGFARRKSSSNALEEVKDAPPSFRVLERPPVGGRSFDAAPKAAYNGGRPFAAPYQKHGLPSTEEERAASNRASGGSNTNSSSNGIYTDNASSTRLSSSSTAPSSTDAPQQDDANQRNQPKPYGVPVPPVPEQPVFSLRAGGRTFSFGSKAPKPSIPPTSRPAEEPPSTQKSLPQIPSTESSDESGTTRARALTESSYASTATPPKLETELESTDFGGGFANMFDGFGKRKSVGLETQVPPSPSAPRDPLSPTGGATSKPVNKPLTPILIDSTRSIDSPPYSWGSNNSNDRLISSTTPPAGTPRSDARYGGVRTLTPTSPSHRAQGRSGAQPGSALRSSTFPVARRSVGMEDEDAKLVMESLNASRALDGWPGDDPSRRRTDDPRAQSNQKGKAPAGLFDSPDMEELDLAASRGVSSQTTPVARKALPSRSIDRAGIDAAKSDPAGPRPTKAANKVMTPAQFEQYRRQQELSRSKSDASKSDEEGDNYDDDDETERNRQLAKQRRKQEAHLSVYRQQMMKVTGEQPSDLPNLGRPSPGSDMRLSYSSPNLPISGAMSSLNVGGDDKSGGAGKNSDDEDDDIPLGILAAHGFPHKARAPSRLSTVPVGAGPAYPPPPASVAGDSTVAGGRGRALPPFARNLPQDPYYGGGPANPSNRESLALGHGGAGFVPGGLTPPGLPPGGLVGVIAGEERARAMRRGSPSGQGGLGPGGAPPGMGRGGMGMGGNGMMAMGGGTPMMSPNDQAQAQATAQLQQMMAMQMEWMQQMMAMQGMQPGQMPQMPQMPGQQPGQPMMNLMPPQMPGQPPHPISMGSNSAPTTPGGQQMHQRTMSMLDPGASSQWNAQAAASGRQSMYAPSMMGHAPGNPAYVPSIAPSERSNVGMPTRYRPVSTLPPPSISPAAGGSRTSMSTLQNWTDQHGGSPTVRGVEARRPSPAANGKGGAGAGDDDDDDEEGWEEMKKKREKKKSTWKLKKGGDGEKGGLGGLFFQT